MLTGIAVMILRSKGYLPAVMLTNSAMEIGNALSALFFVFAMLQNLHLEKNKKIGSINLKIIGNHSFKM